MINILQTEFFRLKKSKLFWALFGVCAGIPLLSAILNLSILSLASGVYQSQGIEVDVWELIRSADMLGGGLSSLTTLMGDSFWALICSSIFLSKEFSGGTFRNMLLANKSRREMYLSYLTIAIVIGAMFLGVAFVSTMIFWPMIFGFGGLSFSTVVTACLVALAMGLVSTIFVQTMMCMFLFGTRKLAVALVVPLAICMIAPSFLLTFIEMFTTLGILNSADLSWIPLYNTSLLYVTEIDGALIGKILMYNIPLSVFFGFMGWVSFRKADLK